MKWSLLLATHISLSRAHDDGDQEPTLSTTNVNVMHSLFLRKKKISPNSNESKMVFSFMVWEVVPQSHIHYCQLSQFCEEVSETVKTVRDMTPVTIVHGSSECSSAVV
jgi:hypothetical protein